MASAINGVFIHIHPSNFSYDKLPKVLRKTNESTTGTRGDLESYHTATIFSSLGASGSKRLPTPSQLRLSRAILDYRYIE